MPVMMSPRVSVVGSIFNLSNTIVGGGISIIALPLAARWAGLFVFPFLVVSLAALSGCTCSMMQHASLSADAGTYAELCMLVGRSCPMIQHVLIVLNNFGICVALLQTFGSVVPPRLVGIWSSPAVCIGSVSALLCVLSAFLKDVRSLVVLSQFALLGVVAFAALVLSHAQEAYSRMGELRHWPETLSHCVGAVSLIALSYACHFNVLPIFNALGRRPRHMQAVIWTSKSLCAAAYLWIGLVSCIVHPESSGDILADFRATSTGRALGALLAVGLVGTVPLFQLEGVHSAQALIQGGGPHRARDTFIACVFLLLAALAAIGAKDPSDVLGLVASACALPIMFVLPPAIFLCARQGQPLSTEGTQYITHASEQTGYPSAAGRLAANAGSTCTTRFQCWSAWAILSWGVLTTVLSVCSSVLNLIS